MAAGQSLEKTADRLARAPLSVGGGGDSISLSEEAVGVLTAQNAYEMNLQVLKMSDEMVKNIVDYLA